MRGAHAPPSVWLHVGWHLVGLVDVRGGYRAELRHVAPDKPALLVLVLTLLRVAVLVWISNVTQCHVNRTMGGRELPSAGIAHALGPAPLMSRLQCNVMYAPARACLGHVVDPHGVDARGPSLHLDLRVVYACRQGTDYMSTP